MCPVVPLAVGGGFLGEILLIVRKRARLTALTS